MRVGDKGVPPGVPRLGVPDMALGWRASEQLLIQSRRTGGGSAKMAGGRPPAPRRRLGHAVSAPRWPRAAGAAAVLRPVGARGCRSSCASRTEPGWGWFWSEEVLVATVEETGDTNRTDLHPLLAEQQPGSRAGLRSVGWRVPWKGVFVCFHCSSLKCRPQPPVRCVMLPFFAVGSAQARVHLCAEMEKTWIGRPQGWYF